MSRTSLSFVAEVPAVNLIGSKALRSAVAATLDAMQEASPYETLADIPQSSELYERPLLLHVNEVNYFAVQLIDAAKSQFGLTPDRDAVLAASILHDVDKALLYVRTRSGLGYSSGRSGRDHGPLGADIALQHDVPAVVADLVRHHSPFSDGHSENANSLEAALLRCADSTAARLASFDRPPTSRTAN